jgi:hypothetical protein
MSLLYIHTDTPEDGGREHDTDHAANCWCLPMVLDIVEDDASENGVRLVEVPRSVN